MEYEISYKGFTIIIEPADPYEDIGKFSYQICFRDDNLDCSGLKEYNSKKEAEDEAKKQIDDCEWMKIFGSLLEK